MANLPDNAKKVFSASDTAPQTIYAKLSAGSQHAFPVVADTRGNLAITIKNADGYTAGIDRTTYALESISYEHHEIHDGSHYFICGHQAFSNGEIIDFTVVTPNSTKLAHMIFSVSGSGAVSLEIHESATVDEAGSAVTAYNNNRNSSNTSSLTIRTGDSFTDEGTMIFRNQVGALKESGLINRERELILKSDTTYIFRITNETTQSNDISYCGEWYEHTDKTSIPSVTSGSLLLDDGVSKILLDDGESRILFTNP